MIFAAYFLGTVSVLLAIIAMGCFLAAVLNRLVPNGSRKGEYVVEPLAEGWFCRNPVCGIFNGDAKEFLRTCRMCGSERPRNSTVLFRS